MLVTSTKITRDAFTAATGWHLKAEGACKGDVCIPLPESLQRDEVDIETLAEAMGLPLVKAKHRDLWALGPESIGTRALVTAEAPNLTLPDLDGNMFSLHSLRGEKVLLFAWAPY